MAKRWSYEEDQIVKENFDTMGIEIMNLLPDRSISAIKLRNRYLKKEEEKRKDLIDVWDQRFWTYVAGVGVEMPNGQNMKENYEKACSMMLEHNVANERGIDVMDLYFKHALSFEEIARLFNVTRERIHQIFKKYIRKMRHPMYRYILEHGEAKPKPDIKIEPIKIPDKVAGSDKIDVLNLSVRAYNCLKRVGIDTIDKLINTPNYELIRIRNMGTKAMQEIETALNRHGLSLNK